MISQRATELRAVNLGQGFPDYDIDPRLGELVAAAMAQGFNQYAPMAGMPALRARIAAQLAQRHGVTRDPEREITITLGATEAIFSAVLALVGAGEEAIVFDPAYDSYDPAVRLAGAHCVHLPLTAPAFLPDWDRVRDSINERTRLIIVNSPHNPACVTLRREDLDALADVIGDRDIRVLSDEVYEHLVFDGRRHESALTHPRLASRSVAVFSFGKSLHATGLRLGYAVADAALTTELRKVHQFNTFTIATCLQEAVARYLAEKPQVFDALPGFFAAKRALLTGLLEGSGLVSQPSQGTYFQLVDYSQLSDAGDMEFATALLEEAGVATIPLSPFYKQPPPLRYVRLCFAKRDETLRQAATRLQAYGAAHGRGRKTARAPR